MGLPSPSTAPTPDPPRRPASAPASDPRRLRRSSPRLGPSSSRHHHVRGEEAPPLTLEGRSTRRAAISTPLLLAPLPLQGRGGAAAALERRQGIAGSTRRTTLRRHALAPPSRAAAARRERRCRHGLPLLHALPRLAPPPHVAAALEGRGGAAPRARSVRVV